MMPNLLCRPLAWTAKTHKTSLQSNAPSIDFTIQSTLDLVTLDIVKKLDLCSERLKIQILDHENLIPIGIEKRLRNQD